jgi:polyphosphate kinase
VDRFLEHARIFFFQAGGKQEIYLSSADWMPRNFVRRVEVMFPIDDKTLRDRVLGEILTTSLADNVKARTLRADGSYQRVVAEQGAASVRSQDAFIALARKRSQAVAAPRAGADVPSGGVFITLSKPPESPAKTNPAVTPPPLLVS